MDREVSLPHPQVPASCLYPEAPQSSLWEHPHESTPPSSVQFSIFPHSSPLTSLWSTHQINLQQFLRVPSQLISLSPSLSLTPASAPHSKTEHRFPPQQSALSTALVKEPI
jgi:hypothetical protein